MNLEKLFKAQQVLRDKINYNEPDRFEKLVLALLVEIGECANCWRGFKFWSKDQKPRTQIEIGNGEYSSVNPLLEEYVDGLHFVLELGIEINAEQLPRDFDIDAYKAIDITKQFNGLMYYGSLMIVDDYYLPLLYNYLALGEMLGFTWDEIEAGYFAKNQINHSRQENGY